MDGVRDAATVVLVRDAPAVGAEQVEHGSLEVFVVRRHPDLVFGGGAHVFPGGAVDPADRHTAVLAHTVGLDDAGASRLVGLPSGGLGFWVAAVREAFEEAGILLTRDADGRISDPEPHGGLRQALNAGEACAADLFAATGGSLHTDDLLVLAHFVTPTGAPRRYDTWFFVAAAPEGQEGAHDDDEAVHSEWLRPGELLARAASGRVTLFGPTPQVLVLLRRYDSAAAVVAAVRAAQTASGGRPGVARDGWGERVVLPGEPGFATTTRTWTQPLVTPDRPLPYDVTDVTDVVAPAEGVA